MKYFLILLLSGIILAACDTKQNANVTESTTEIFTPMEDAPILRHVVLFKFNEDATPEIVKNIEDAFSALPSKISAISDYEWGLNNSPEGLNKGLTHCFFVSFKSEADRAAYLPHPDHQAFVALIGPYVGDVTVVDYWTK